MGIGAVGIDDPAADAAGAGVVTAAAGASARGGFKPIMMVETLLALVDMVLD